MMEDLLQSKFVSCAILGTLQKYYRRVQGDKFLQLRGFNARYAAGMSSNGFQTVVRTMFDLLEKKSEGSITLNREYVVQLKTHFGPVSVAKLTHLNPTQHSLRKEMLSADLCEQWIPKKLEVDGDGQCIFCHPSTSALDFMSCVKCIAYGVSSMREKMASRFTKCQIPGVRNLNIKLGGDGAQRTNKQAATQIRLLGTDFKALLNTRSALINIMQFGSNVSEGHLDVRRDLRLISNILRLQKERPLDYVVNVYPNTKTEQNTGEEYREEGNPPVAGEQYAFSLWMNQDLAFLQKVMGSTGPQGVESCDVARIPKAHVGEPLLFTVVNPQDVNDFGRERFLNVISNVVKPEVTNKKYDGVFSLERNMMSRLLKDCNADFYEAVNAGMHAQRTLQLEK